MNFDIGVQQWANTLLEKADAKILAECARIGDKIPYYAENGVYNDMRTENLSWWTNGFWAGMLWQMYHATARAEYRLGAEKIEIMLDDALQAFDGLHHDVGFMWLHTAVANWRLTGNVRSKSRGMHAATLLAGRFNLRGSYIRAWNRGLPGWVIIDSMMNLPLLHWATEVEQDPRFAFVAQAHADMVSRVFVRENGSCHHIAVFDPLTGEVLEYPPGQGYASGSSWTRGQAWAIYGFALAAQHSGNPAYSSIAKKVADYFIAEVSKTAFITPVDFCAPLQPEKIDTTAAACAVCGLLQLAALLPDADGKKYTQTALEMLHALVEKHCDWAPESDGILQNGTAAYHKQEESAVSIIYGDYFLVEAVLRILGKDFLIW